MQHRVLHILSGMNRGGIETWIMNVMRAIDTDAIRFDFLVEATAPGSYDDEIRQRGGRILRAPRFRHRGRFARRLIEVLRREGPYDVVHAHGSHDSGLATAIAAAHGVPVRIGHVHNIISAHEKNAVQRAYKQVMKRVMRDSATWVLGCSTAALESLYGPDMTRQHPKLEMLPYGIDLQRFQRQSSRAGVMQELDIPPGSRIAGHVGRFVPQKNHDLLVDLIAELARRDPRWVLLLVGDGPLRPAIEQRLAAMGLSRHVRFAGVQADVPRFMSAMDVFVFPSRFEGFGLVMVEAEAVGLPCVISTVIPEEVNVVAPLIQRLKLDHGAAAWADAVERAAAATMPPAEAHAAVARSVFAIERSVARLLSRYYGFAQAG